MIQAKDLRIGNLFWENYGGYKVVSGINCHKNNFPVTVDAHGIGYTAIGRFDLESIEPIPITPEILEKCGAKYNGGEGYVLPNGIAIYASLRNGWMINQSQKIPNIKGYEYLHQLQNAIYAITGEELTYNK